MFELGHKSVLVVEDDLDTAELERRALTRAGMIVHLAHTARDAQAFLQTRTFQAVLLDFRLPDGDPWEIVEIARSLTPPVPVVLITAMGSEQLVAEAFHRGVADYISKTDAFWNQLPKTVERVAELAHAQCQLRRSESLFQIISAHATDLIVTLDTQGVLRYISPACRSILARDAADLIGTKLIDIVDPQHRENRLFSDLGDVHNPSRRDVIRCCRGDGKGVWLEADLQLVRDADTGRISEVLGVLRDITDRRNAEEKLKESEARFRASFEAATHGMALVSTEGRWLKVNKALCEIVGYSEQELLESDFQTITHVDDLDKDLDYVGRLLAGTIDNYQMEKRYVHKQGHIVWILLSVSLVRDTKYRPVHFVSQILNITSARESEQALREAKEEAEHANNLKTGFLATMSHEIRTPMNGILGLVDILLRSHLSDEQRRLATLLRDAGASLLAIINDILDLSKVEAGKLTFEFVPINVAQLVEGALSIVRTQAAAKGLQLQVELGPTVPAWVGGDAVRLRQVLLNLLSNGIKFTDRGRVTVRIGMMGGSDERVLFEIEDTGSGIANADTHLLFKKFSQVDRSITRRYGGTGLGLAICKRLIEAMPQGQIGVESDFGSGSRFWFAVRLPVVSAPMTGEEKPDAVPGASLKAKASILVAEDNYINQVVVERMLTDAGHRVVIARNGHEAVRAIGAQTFDLVLMDMEMPEMDGISATQAIRAMAFPVGAIPIIALTANAMPEAVARCKEAGMQEHLPKPLRRETLMHAVERWTNRACVDDALVEENIGLHVFDSALLANLKNLVGADKVLRLLTMFREQISASLDVISDADATAISREAHTIASTAGTFGFVELMSTSRELMNAINSSDADTRLQIARMRNAVARAVTALDAEFLPQPPPAAQTAYQYIK